MTVKETTHKRPLSIRGLGHSVEFAMALERAEFVRRLREARRQAGLTQSQAAQQVGVELKSYNRWEALNNGTEPRGRNLDRLVEVLGVDREYLLGPPPGQQRPDERLDELMKALEQADARQTRYARYLNAKLDLLFAHLGVEPDQLPAAPDELTAALDEIQARPKRTRRTIQPPSVSGQS